MSDWIALAVGLSVITFLVFWASLVWRHYNIQPVPTPTREQFLAIQVQLQVALEELASAKRQIEVLTGTVQTLLDRLEARQAPLAQPKKPEPRVLAISGQQDGWPSMDEIAIHQAIESIRHTSPWQVKHASATTMLRLLRELEEGHRGEQPTRVLMFICHGGEGKLFLHGKDSVDSGWLGDQIKEYGVEGVVLAACWSDSLTEALLNHGAKWVLAADDKIDFRDALTTVSHFMGQLGAGGTTGKALHYARSLMKRPDTKNMVELRGDRSWRWAS